METEKKSWPIVLGLSFAGLVLLFLGFYPKPNSSKSADGKNISVIAQAFRENGNAWVLDPQLEKTMIEKRLPIGYLDSVETGTDGQVLLQFENGASVSLAKDTLITLESEPGPEEEITTILLKRGNLKVEKTSVNQSLWIGKNGERILAENFDGSTLQRQDFQPKAPSDPGVEQVSPGLNEEEIVGTLVRYRSNFVKCYTNLLQRNSEAKGKVNLSFTIENSGKLSTAEVTFSELPDPEFKGCLVEALRRVSFRSFQGAAISSVFPMEFE